ncbi:hypothetical protein ACFHPT_03020 [Enterococcus faecium]|uniref:hypothetical protein n=1 Tax=Enterococcus faecium TaxID=1352 RepID=UPI00376FD86D
MAFYRPLKKLQTMDEYRMHYEKKYCTSTILTHQGLPVRFYPERFDHAFYKNSNRRTKDKSLFSLERAERIDWIEEVLKDPNVTIYAGWDSKKKRHDFSHRASLITPDGYVVVIRKINDSKATFVTAYVIDDLSVFDKIKSNPIIYEL